MSMRTYVSEGYGIILGEKEFLHMNKVMRTELCELNLESVKEGQPKYFVERDDYDEAEIAEYFDAVNYSGYEGDAYRFNENGEEEETDESYDGETTLYILPLDKEPGLFHAAYESIGEAVDELKKKYGKFLPPDYDYANNIYHLRGTIYG